jgi:tetratricopeptide (TPR) repeat protein
MHRLGDFLIGLLALLIGAGLTMWFIWRTIKKAEDPGRIVYKWVISFVILIFLVILGAKLGFFGYGGAFIGPIAAACCGIVLGILWAPHLGAVLAAPFTAFYDGGDASPEVRPFYSIARAKQKRGHYQEAVAEVRKQLERFSQDYEGWMLLAEIYAENLKDNAAAQNCIEEILRQEGHAPRNIVFALNRSADWHLGLASDRDSARAVLEEIVRRYPGSEHSHNAAQRIAHLTTDKMLLDHRETPIIHLTRRDEYIGLQGAVADPRPAAEEPGVAASRLIGHLQSHPADVEAREQLAEIYAHQYQRTDLANDQLEQLIASPGASPKEIAHWLNMRVDFHRDVDQNEAAARATLERIMTSFPGSAAAGLAESRLMHLTGEFRKNKKSQVLKLGSYEGNVGLKGQVPKRPA